MADNSTFVCSSSSQDPNTQIILSALAVLGTIITFMAQYCLKKPGVQRLVGLGARADRKKQLHDSIRALQPMIDEVAKQLSGKSDSPDVSTDDKKQKAVITKDKV